VAVPEDVGVEEDVPFVRNPASWASTMAKAMIGGRRGLAHKNVDASAATASGGRQLSNPTAELFPYDLPTHIVILILTGLATAGSEKLSGIWSPQYVEFDPNNGLIYAYGFLTATVYDSGGAVLATSFDPLTLHVRVSHASCDSVTLTFGPNVRTIEGVSFIIPAVSTTITAQPDIPLVGDVLCAIADLTALTNPPGSAYALAQLLQELLIAYTGFLNVS
jgi:hypothetical protein